jgi:glycosyltransferase involved in cell wall biosynthesis
MKRPPWHMSVIVPARDEEKLLPRCLRSVLTAAAMMAGAVTTDIVVAVNRSRDNSSRISQDLIGSHGVVVKTEFGTVGAVRSAAVATAISRCPTPLRRCWLANTDADSAVPPTWLMDQYIYALRGVEAIAGTIDVDSFNEHGPEVSERFRSTYLIEADGSHPHIHGANLGVRADVYRAAGGWSDLSTGEDHDLWRRLRDVDCRTLSTARLKVLTSGRRNGRAPKGFADALAAHNEAAA